MARLSGWHWWKQLADFFGDGRRGTAARQRLRSRLSLEVYEDRCVPTTVTTLADAGPGSLRDALASTPAGGTVDFQPGLSGTITLTSGELAIAQSVAIEGPGADRLTVSGNQASRVFDISQTGLTVTIAGLTIANGVATGQVPQGGGMFIAGGDVTLADCSLTGNMAVAASTQPAPVPQGGGMFIAGGDVTLADCSLTGNHVIGGMGGAATPALGGGIYIGGGNVTLTDCNLAGNGATGGGIPIAPGLQGAGGGVYVAGGSLAVHHSTFSANQATGGNAGTTYPGGRGDGGGIFVAAGSLVVDDSAFASNQATGAHDLFQAGGAGSGGGIYVAGGSVQLNGSSLANNTAIGADGGDALSHSSPGSSGGAGFGGGIYVAGGTLAIGDSTLTGNQAIGGVGGNAGMLGNPNGGAGGAGGMALGGGIDVAGGSAQITESTFAANQATGGRGGNGGFGLQQGGNGGDGGQARGSGLYLPASTAVTDSTITLNRATGGSGGAPGTGGRTNGHPGANGLASGGGLVTTNGRATMLRNTIVAADSAASSADVAVTGTLNSQGYNLIGDGSGGSGFADTDLVGTTANPIDPRLGPLADNGGPTQTMALLPGSPAVDAGDPAQLGVPDQRGLVRSGGVNIGAYQASATAFLVSAPAKVTAGVPFGLTVTAVDPFGQVAVGYTGTVTFGTTDPDPGVVLPADYAFTAADAGAHTFSDTGRGETTLRTRGAQAITVTDTADGSITGSATVKVRHQRHHAGGADAGAGREVAAADRFFAALHEGDWGFLGSSAEFAGRTAWKREG